MCQIKTKSSIEPTKFCDKTKIPTCFHQFERERIVGVQRLVVAGRLVVPKVKLIGRCSGARCTAAFRYAVVVVVLAGAAAAVQAGRRRGVVVRIVRTVASAHQGSGGHSENGRQHTGSK